MSIAELLPSIASLPHADKFRLMQVLLEQMAEEENINLNQENTSQSFEPQAFFGLAQCSKQEIDDYLQQAREGWD